MTYAAWLLVIGVLLGTYTAGMATVLVGQSLRAWLEKKQAELAGGTDDE